MDLLGVQADLTKTQAMLQEALDRIAALETQSAKDLDTLATKVIDGLSPMVKQGVDAINTATIAVSNGINEVVTLARRIDGATFKLGPE